MKNLLLVLMMILMPLSVLAQNDSDDAEDKAAAAEEQRLQKAGVNTKDPGVQYRSDGAINKKGEPNKVPKVTCAGCEAQMTDGEFNADAVMEPADKTKPAQTTVPAGTTDN